VLPVWSSQIIRQMRSVSPRSMTCRGVEPSNAGFGRFSHSPIALASTMSDSASKRRVNSMRRFWAEPLGVRSLAQCATARGENEVMRINASWVTPNESQKVRTENSLFALWVENTASFRVRGCAPFAPLLFEAVPRTLFRLPAIPCYLSQVLSSLSSSTCCRLTPPEVSGKDDEVDRIRDACRWHQKTLHSCIKQRPSER
jgi:hypothetical protein